MRRSRHCDIAGPLSLDIGRGDNLDAGKKLLDLYDVIKGKVSRQKKGDEDGAATHAIQSVVTPC